MAYIDNAGRDICPRCLFPLPKHKDQCVYRGLDADDIDQLLDR